MSKRVKISSALPHHGEEPPLSGTKGSGAIFFCGCNLHCVFCQNYQISQKGLGRFISTEELAGEMLKLQARGCHNLNFVSPTHFAAQILEAISIAREAGLLVPLVWNSHGCDKLETLKLLDGKIDIYLPDIKYSHNQTAEKFSGVKNYLERSRAAIAEMFKQVGNLKVTGQGLAQRGIIVRHLILPNDLAGSLESLKFLKSLSAEIWVGLMAQYHPCYKAREYPEINRPITSAEYTKVVNSAKAIGLTNLLVQDLASHSDYLPDFEEKEPFG